MAHQIGDRPALGSFERALVLVAETADTATPDLKAALLRRGLEVAVATGEELPRELEAKRPNMVVMLPRRSDAGHWIEMAGRIRKSDSPVRFILIAREGDEALAVAALRAGMSDYFRYTASAEEVAGAVERCLGRQPCSPPSPDLVRPAGHGCSMVGDSAQISDIRARIATIARVDSNVLITGETGTGKELVAKLIHGSSHRQAKPFLSINCAAIPETLLESELFGYERGAFTGAHSAREGSLRLAAGGSVLFDEIGDMSGPAQAKILRAIETKEVRRLGGQRTLPLDVRVIAATNQDLERMVEAQRFRRDLYYRINVAHIHLPPLRDRKVDVPRLVEHYVGEFNRQFNRRVEGLTDEALDCLLHYDWPGNIRELRNLLEATFVNLPSRRISLIDLPERFRAHLQEAAGVPREERARLLNALFATKWNKSKAAAQLQWSRMTIYRKIARYGIVRGADDPIARR